MTRTLRFLGLGLFTLMLVATTVGCGSPAQPTSQGKTEVQKQQGGKYQEEMSKHKGAPDQAPEKQPSEPAK